MDIDLSFLAGPISGLSTFFTNLARSERSKEAGEYKDNAEEAAATDEEISATQVTVSFDGKKVKLSLETSGSMWDSVTTGGKGIAMIGGQGGTVTEPDGSTRMSNVPPQLWGTRPVDDSAEPASLWKENFMKMAESLLPGLVQDIIASSKAMIADAIKPQIVAALGGAFA